ncbi:MAG: PilT/PilU family type 4a pilus ATPase [Planctomycetota bacterium]|nr:PilT/PilU family type 4a pilus ATPase [Planctomycetota bacterium]
MNDTTASPPIKKWLMEAALDGASDLHLVAEYPPIRREHGELVPVNDECLSAAQVHAALREICVESAFQQFEQHRNLDFALEESGQHPDDPKQRYRVNLFYSGESPGACIRVIPATIPDLEWSGFPRTLADRITELRNGLVVFSGMTGSGKTTSMAMMIQQLARNAGRRIVTIEDPIEYRFPNSNKSVITQREIGRDVDTFADGLKHAMRQDPDIILVGEIRDQATARMALSAAETGHLVLTTLHTRDAKGAITRLVDLFPTHNHSETCSMLAIGLRLVVCQHLLPSATPGQKRELALEVMLNTNPIAAAIRTGRIDSLDNAILTGRKDGMLLLDDSIKNLYREARIDRETAERFISDKSLL